MVTDTDGRPLRDVWINHTGVPVENLQTDSQGRFDVECRGPAIVFRKRGFQSKYWRVRADLKLKIVLIGPAPQLKICRNFSKCVSLNELMSTFCLPRIPGVNVGKQGNDDDYVQRFFWMITPRGRIGIQHASGPLWGSGLPFDEDVWSARGYAETSYVDPEGFAILDARGNSADGKHWRVLGHAFETARYRNVAEQDTALLDRVLDGACVKPFQSQ